VTALRVLVVDDSVVARRIITDVLQSAPDIEVAGAAASGSIALQKIGMLVPDVVTLDVDMPGMDGIETVTRIRETWPNLPVIMCSTLTERGADVTLRALTAGASDYVAKPSSLSGGSGIDAFGTELLAKIRGFGTARMGVRPSLVPAKAATPSLAPRAEAVRARREPVLCIAIGSSTGGPNALTTLFGSLPRDLAVPVLIAQHMPPMFTRLLAERLTASTGFRVDEAVHGDLVEPGRAYVAPGNYHMTVERERTRVRIVLNQEPQENSCRPAVDVLFRSVARLYGAGTLAAVLTGMGYDGTRGAQAIVEAGGEMLVQDAASCVVPSMPSSVAAAIKVDGVYPIDRMGMELAGRVFRRGARERVLRVEELGRTT
jgi:two-component system chemotaxis response regulator CheB